MSFRCSLLSLALLNFLSLGRAGPNDVTYDDTDPNWIYHPASSWGAISEAHPCVGCNTQPDFKKAHEGTWHDLSKGGSAQFSFVGSSVAVYAICPRNIYRSNFTFLLDNEPAGLYLAPEGGCADYQYDQIIFHKSGLPVRPHIFQVNNWIKPGEEFSTSDLVIDYAVVNPDASSGSATGGSSTPRPTTTSRPGSTIQPPTNSPSATVSAPAVPTATTTGRTTTIDDADITWTYNGPSWGQISAANPCPSCQTQPDATKAYATTWHDLSGEGSATLLFSGNAISVYTICPGPLEDGGAFSANFAFFLDGKANGTFLGSPEGCSSYQYDQRVYEAKSLTQGTHNFTIVNIIAATGNKSDLILDYAVIEAGTVPGNTLSSTVPLPSTPPDAAANLYAPHALLAAFIAFSAALAL